MRVMQMRVTGELLQSPAFLLPSGYWVVGYSYDEQTETYDLTIKGLFPGFPGTDFNVHNVSASVSRIGDSGSWQWTLNGDPVGPPIEVKLPAMAIAA